jgi:hypothetical protein
MARTRLGEGDESLELIFLTPADLLALDYLNVPVASVLRPEGRRHYVGGNINYPPCLCGHGRKLWEYNRGLWAARCPICEIDDILAWLRGDEENSSTQILRHKRQSVGFGDVENP